jgi:hypothetical protein
VKSRVCVHKLWCAAAVFILLAFWSHAVRKFGNVCCTEQVRELEKVDAGVAGSAAVTMWLYRYEAKGIQSYVLSTQVLREMAGASQLVETLADDATGWRSSESGRLFRHGKRLGAVGS